MFDEHPNPHPMKELTKAEEQVMQILWQLGQGFVKDILDQLPEPKPAYNTVSTIVRILEKKGFVGYKAYGKTHEYYPLIARDDYRHFYLKNFMAGYFGGSLKRLVSFFAKEENMDLKELEEMLKHVKEDLNNKEDE
jgi:BlaI family transcriptional regulator, penicillinase repressor